MTKVKSNAAEITLTIITVNFKNGKTAKYSHDKVYEVMKEKLENMNCFQKYKSYTASNNVPLVAREICE